MKSVLLIGTTCVDIILTIDHLPSTEEDINPTSQTTSIGGCAFNAANIVRQSGTPLTFASPVGTGMYGNFVYQKLTELGFPIFHRDPEENGCCYCLVERNGERTFLSYHGVEYSFNKEWMNSINIDDYSYIYVCGLEIEEPTGIQLIEYLEENRGPQIMFCPGARITSTPSERVNRMLALHPILHLNKDEILRLSGENDLESACASLWNRTHNLIIVTLGPDGACCTDSDGHIHYVEGFPSSVTDTIGAGDSHAGQMLAELSKGTPLLKAVSNANLVSSYVVSVKGASLKDSEYNNIPIE